MLGVLAPHRLCGDLGAVPQGELPADQDELRTITRHNAIDVLSTGTRYPCVGVYAIVDTAGDIRTGDTVTVT